MGTGGKETYKGIKNQKIIFRVRRTPWERVLYNDFIWAYKISVVERVLGVLPILETFLEKCFLIKESSWRMY